MDENFKIGVVGTGYVGLVTGACLAHIGHQVICVDKDEEKVGALEKGRMPIYEPHLEDLVSSGVASGSLCFATRVEEIVENADVVFIAVDTPQDDNGAADLSSVAAVAYAIGRALACYARDRPLIVVNKSTVPVGSGDYVSMLVREGAKEPVADEAKSETNKEANFRVVSNPEFLREGSAVYDSLYPDRIVLGAESQEALGTMRMVYEPIVEQSFPTEIDPRPRVTVPFVTTDLASAEMIKYAANAFLATKISFINEIANICELVGADVSNVALGIGLDERIGPRFLSAGIGWGGSCFPKDVSALRSIAREYDYTPAVLDATVSVNERQRKQVVAKLQRDLHTLKGKRVALLGLAFKPNTDDLREAPSLQIAATLNALGARVVGYDPVAGKQAAARVASEQANPGESCLEVVFDLYEALEGAHAVVLVTEWREICNLNLKKAAELMESPKVLIDGRNAVDPESARSSGILYRGFGRG